MILSHQIFAIYASTQIAEEQDVDYEPGSESHDTANLVGLIRPKIDRLSANTFRKMSDLGLLQTAARFGITSTVGIVQLKRGRPVLPMTSGDYTTGGRRIVKTMTVLSIPYLGLAVNELVRRRNEKRVVRRFLNEISEIV